jgi:hypothetical protein
VPPDLKNEIRAAIRNAITAPEIAVITDKESCPRACNGTDARNIMNRLPQTVFKLSTRGRTAMYVRIRERVGDAMSGNFGTGTAQSNLWQRKRQIYPGLGQPAPSTPACIPKPPWIPPLKHFFSPKARVFRRGTSKLEWESTPTADELRPGSLNPGYIASATHLLLLDRNLDKKLKELMANLRAKKPPFDSDPFKTFVDKGGKIRVALVDLSTDLNLIFPSFAEYDSATETYGASLAKIGALYAAHQLRFDLNVQAKINPPSMTADRIRKLKTIFDVTQGGHPLVTTLEFNTSFLNALDEICENWAANTIIRALGFPYIASALWQSGLYDCRRGGIWLGGLYDGCKTLWRLDPIGNQCHGVTALSVATFFTLLEQGRLINDQSSQKIKDILVMQPTRCGSRFKAGLESAGRFTTSDRIYSKIGIFGSFSHEGALIERISIGKKYVAVVLTESKALNGGEVRKKLIAHLDKLIETNP